MPKKNGITKTYSFEKEIVKMLTYICEKEHRTQTNMIEKLIAEKYNEEQGFDANENRKTEN